jgi:putative transposase
MVEPPESWDWFSVEPNPGYQRLSLLMPGAGSLAGHSYDANLDKSGSWDITKLRGPVKWTYFYLYVILDVFSRYVTGWMVAHRESAELARKFLEETIAQHRIPPSQLNLHADRGRVMRSKPVAFLLADLGVTRTHSRPYVSDDNPYSESQFRTLKYRPDFPDRFGSIQDSRAFCQQFFAWYNHQHHHSGLGMLTPAMVHLGQVPAVLAQRQAVLDAASLAHPERFVRHPPKPLPLPSEVWINRPPSGGPDSKKGSQ